MTVLFVLSLGVRTPLSASDAATASMTASNPQQQLAGELAAILRAARKVLSDNQDLINDPAKGDKGLSPEVVIAKTRENYLAAMRMPLPTTEGDSKPAVAARTLLAAVQAIMEKAQPLINEPNKGFKGFLPAVFAGQVAAEFSRAMEGKAFIKLTAPAELVRNRRNRPDEWESQVIETKFKLAGWTRGAAFTEHGDHRGKPAERLILPEYYVESCLKCHGLPKGDRDITGGLKEGAALGDLGGAISVVIYDEH